MPNFALINKTTGVVENIAVWDGVTPWNVPTTHQIRNVSGLQAKVWKFDDALNDYVSVIAPGQVAIGDTVVGNDSGRPKPSINPKPPAP